ncbi:MAG: peptidoglycan editing factor PgeF [Cyanobacteria bacterium NC_groundwater_1444_Ag_S-0.65um_54_12]|nr:peptidoglycan editing factor PgeF [Cyanobacteria bacterium NC_groundwater_1444_Ag_S-0.65um_54_12]
MDCQIPAALAEGWELSPGGTMLRYRHFPVKHAFSTRLGGVSVGPYATLNLSNSVGDSAEAVRENRERFLHEADIASYWATVQQVHGNRSLAISALADCAGQVADALLTDRSNIPIGVYVADCTPILLASVANQRVVAVIHAGWRGTAAKLVAHTVEHLCQSYGIKPKELLALIGPAARGCCYEVGSEVVAALRQSDPGPAVMTHEPGWVIQEHDQLRVDLPLLIKRQLESTGLPAESIQTAGLCTLCCSDLCFSYRRHGKSAGRMVAVIELSS